MCSYVWVCKCKYLYLCIGVYTYRDAAFLHRMSVYDFDFDHLLRCVHIYIDDSVSGLSGAGPFGNGTARERFPMVPG